MRWMYLPFLLYYYLCSISSNVLNDTVDCTDGDDSFGFNSVLSFIMQIKLEAPTRQRGREREEIKDAAKII